MTDLTPPREQGGLDSINVSVDDGVADITWTFRSQHEGGGSQKDEFELSGSVSQEPITSHPKYEMLFDKYAYAEEDGEPQWFEKDPEVSSGNGLTREKEKSTLSPLYGVRDYMAANSVYKEIKYYRGRASVPADLISKCGKIDDPSSLRGSKPGRWLRCGAGVRQMGDSYQVTTMWMASQSESNLWKPEIYG